MSDGAARPRRGDTVAAYVLLLAHGVLALLTIVGSASFLTQDEYVQSRCRSHDLDCSHRWITAADWIAIGLSAVLVILDWVLFTRLRAKRQLSFVVPMFCCVVQFIVFWALGAINR